MKFGLYSFDLFEGSELGQFRTLFRVQYLIKTTSIACDISCGPSALSFAGHTVVELHELYTESKSPSE